MPRKPRASSPEPRRLQILFSQEEYELLEERSKASNEKMLSHWARDQLLAEASVEGIRLSPAASRSLSELAKLIGLSVSELLPRMAYTLRSAFLEAKAKKRTPAE